MPATNKTPPTGGRRTTNPDPFSVDMTEVPMTPAMTSLHQASKLLAQVNWISHFLEEIVLDGSELTLAEGQTATHVMRAQGRGFKWRAQFNRILKRERNIDLAKMNWRYRTKNLEPEAVPPYMSPEILTAMRELVEPLHQMLQDPSRQREKLYPAIHKRTKPRIEGDLP